MVPRIDFRYLISHTFPGWLFSLEIIVIISHKTFACPINLWKELVKSWQSLLGIISIFLVVGTLVGVIIDGVQHLIFDLIEKIMAKARHSPYKVYLIHDMIRTKEELDIFRYFVEDSLWYYYEAYVNCAIALIPSLWIVPRLSEILHADVIWLYPVLIGIISALALEGILTYLQARELEREMREELKRRRTCARKPQGT